jgi:uncharacterized membrane protein YesL
LAPASKEVVAVVRAHLGGDSEAPSTKIETREYDSKP